MASVDSQQIVGPLAAAEILTIGPYHVLRRIGSGGQGEVFYCCHADDEERPLALKLFRSTDLPEQDRMRFRRECETLARLSHPNIAELYDAGEWEGRPYLVMEFVSGRSITEYCHEHQLPLKTRVSLLREVCLAISHAHESGIIHRDVKPSNILVDDESTPCAKVIDFGVCKDANATSILTQNQQFVGTLPYASPEQVGDESGSLDQRSDIYGLGLLMYEVMTGLPVVNRGDFADSVEVREYICKRKPMRPSKRAKSYSRNASELRIPSELDAIILKSLEKNPDRRYPSVDVLMADIDRYLNGQRVLSQPPTFFYELKEFIRSHKKVAGTVVLFMTLLAAIAIVAVNYAVKASNEAEARATAEFDATEKAETLNAVNALFLKDVLAPPASATPELLQETVFERLKRISPRIDSLLVDQPELQLSIRERLGGAFAGNGEYLRAAEEYEKARLLSERVFGADDRRTLSARYLLADAYVDSLSEAPLGLSLIEGLLRESNAALGDDDPFTVRCKKLLADAQIECGQYVDATRLLERILPSEKELLALAYTTRRLAVAHQGLSNRERSEQLYLAAMSGFDQSLGADNAESAYTKYQLAILYMENREAERAEALLREAHELLCQSLGEFHANSVRCLGPLAGAVNRQKRHEEATTLYLAAIEGEQQLKGAGHTGEWHTLCHYARVLRETGDLDNADAIARYVLRKQHQAYGDVHPHTVGTIRTLASVQQKRGNYGQEAWLHTRLLSARFMLNGVFTKEFFDAGRELAEAILNWRLQQLLEVFRGDTATQSATVDQFDGKIPMVLRDPWSGVRVFVWSKPTRGQKNERSLPVSTR